MSGSPLRVLCPAKVNLHLKVVGRRDDGYHELRTVFQAVDLHDSLELVAGEDLRLQCSDPNLPTGEENLVLRAALELRRRGHGGGKGAKFTLFKRIPSGAGLGGGSSDAAGALLALDRLWDLDLGRESLAEIGSSIGADVPFFLYGGTALGTGRGDRIEPLPFRGEFPVLLGFPPFGISTAEVYRDASRRLTLPVNDVSLSRPLTLKVPGGKDFGPVENDLETVVFERWPELRAFRDALMAVGAEYALLSGSGSTVFGVFENEEVLSDALNELRSRFGRWNLIRTRAIQESVRLMPET